MGIEKEEENSSSGISIQGVRAVTLFIHYGKGYRKGMYWRVAQDQG